MADQEYRLVVRDRVSTVHKFPSLEQCNLDSSDADIAVDESTGAHLIDKGEAVYCAHCFPGEPG